MKTKQKIYGHKLLSLLMILIFSTVVSSCKKYLDYKPDKKMVIPETLQDCQALLDNYGVMNNGIGVGEVGTDDYFMIYAHWNAIGKPHKDLYVWDKDTAPMSGDWIVPYNTVFYANQVIETLNQIGSAKEPQTWNVLKGSALFYRAYAFFQLTQAFCQPYNVATVVQDPGIPLRLSPDVNIKAERGTLKQVYDQIIKDLNEAITLLPTIAATKSRPGKPAAYAALARTYLVMQDYLNSGLNADKCLKIYNTLLDYNNFDETVSPPFGNNNEEVLFASIASGNFPLYSIIYKMDPLLYASYNDDDLRKSLFFKANADGTFGFRGHYDDRLNETTFFNGFATDEMYLTRAECYARAGNTGAALEDLNTLMKKRWSNKVTYPTIIALNATEALDKILTERRKELIQRGVRWSDLRRLNMESRYAKTIIRTINSATYSLPPKDLRYTWLIPLEALANTDMQQNKR